MEKRKKGPWIAPEAYSVDFCWLEQHVERVGTESGTSIDTHVDAKLLALEPLADTRKVVLIQESESVGLQRVVKIHRYTSIELTILLEHEDGKRSIVAVFLLLEIYIGSVVVVCLSRGV